MRDPKNHKPKTKTKPSFKSGHARREHRNRQKARQIAGRKVVVAEVTSFGHRRSKTIKRHQKRGGTVVRKKGAPAIQFALPKGVFRK